MIRIGIVATVAIYREGLATAIRRRPDLDIAWTASALPGGADGAAAVVLMAGSSDSRTVRREVAAATDRVRPADLAVVTTCDDTTGRLGWFGAEDPLDSLIEYLRGLDAGSHDEAMVPGSLTTRELEIVELINVGFSNRQIADELYIGEATVKNHVHHILTKLGVARRGEAAALVREWRAEAEGMNLLVEAQPDMAMVR